MQPLRILIADDEPLGVAALSATLTALGHQVVGTATNGAQAVELARELEPDLVILDVRMPVMTGPEAAIRIAEHRPVPMLILSAYSDEQTVQHALSSPVAAYLVKPIDAEDLAPAIALARAQFQATQAREERLRTAEARLEARKVIDRAKGILMERRGLTEDAAYRLMRTESQNQAVPMRVLADRIIAAHESPAQKGSPDGREAARRPRVGRPPSRA